jgi:hypothetical protein
MRTPRFFWMLLLVLTAAVSRCTCIDLKTPRAYPCEMDAGNSQCPNGWRCGLEGYCHEEGTAAPYTCATDQDCEANWRCGPDGKCVDSSNEGLPPMEDAGTVTATLISPRTAPIPPSHVAMARTEYLDAGCGEMNSGYTLSEITDAGLRRVFVVPGGLYRLADGGIPTTCSPDLKSVTVFETQPVTGLSGVEVLAEQNLETFTVHDGGTVCRTPFVENGVGTPACAPNTFGFTPTDLRVSMPSASEVVAFNRTKWAVLDTQTNAVTGGITFTTPDGGTSQILDMVALGDDWSRSYVAATNHGLFLNTQDISGNSTYYTGWRWEPVTLENSYCGLNGGGSSSKIRSIRAFQGYNGWELAATERTDFGGGTFYENLIFHRAGSGVSSGGCFLLPAPNSGGDVFVRNGSSCSPCNNNYRIHAVHVTPRESSLQTTNGLNYDIQAWCVSETGQAPYLSISLDGNCGRFSGTSLPVLERFNPNLVSGNTNPFHPVFAGTSTIFFSQEQQDFSLTSMFLDRAPSVVTGEGSDLVAHASKVTTASFGDTQGTLARSQSFRLVAAGFSSAQGDMMDTPLFASIQNRPTWAVAGDEESDPPFFGVLDMPQAGEDMFRVLGLLTETEVFKAPFLGAAATTPTGGTQLIVTSFDALLATDITEWEKYDPPGGFEEEDMFNAPRLSVKLIPLSRSPITSMVVMPPDTTSAKPPLVLGYLLTAGRVYRFTAANQTVWRTDELLLPDGEPLQIYSDNERARVGFREGTVWSLPSRVKLADELPSNAFPATSYVSVCGQTFVLAKDGVYRLIPAGATGTWEKIELSTSLTGTTSFTDAKLHATPKKVLLFMNTGRTLELSPSICGP